MRGGSGRTSRVLPGGDETGGARTAVVRRVLGAGKHDSGGWLTGDCSPVSQRRTHAAMDCPGLAARPCWPAGRMIAPMTAPASNQATTQYTTWPSVNAQWWWNQTVSLRRIATA